MCFQFYVLSAQTQSGVSAILAFNAKQMAETVETAQANAALLQAQQAAAAVSGVDAQIARFLSRIRLGCQQIRRRLSF
jgi:hypothetical protein